MPVKCEKHFMRGLREGAVKSNSSSLFDSNGTKTQSILTCGDQQRDTVKPNPCALGSLANTINKDFMGMKSKIYRDKSQMLWQIYLRKLHYFIHNNNVHMSFTWAPWRQLCSLRTNIVIYSLRTNIVVYSLICQSNFIIFNTSILLVVSISSLNVHRAGLGNNMVGVSNILSCLYGVI